MDAMASTKYMYRCARSPIRALYGQVKCIECPVAMPGEIRVKVLAAGVSLPDVLAREGVHPETSRVPYTPGWDLVGLVDQTGEGVSGFELGQMVAAMPISGCYAQYICLPQHNGCLSSKHGTHTNYWEAEASSVRSC